MVVARGRAAFDAPLGPRIVLFVAEEVGGVIPERAGINARTRRLGVAGDDKLLRRVPGLGLPGLVSFGDASTDVLDLMERAVGLEDDAERDFLGGVAGSRQLVVLVSFEAFVEFVEGLEDHGQAIA